MSLKHALLTFSNESLELWPLHLLLIQLAHVAFIGSSCRHWPRRIIILFILLLRDIVDELQCVQEYVFLSLVELPVCVVESL